MPNKTPCKPFSVEVAFLTTDNLHLIDFGLTKKCNHDTDDTSFWMIDFKLKDKKSDSDNFFVRLEVHIKVGDDKTAKAEALATKVDATDTLPQTQADLLLGPIKNRALQLGPGMNNDSKLKKLVSKMVD